MGVMAHTQSLERIVFAVFHHLNQNWSQRPLQFTHNSWRYRERRRGQGSAGPRRERSAIRVRSC